MKLTTKGRYALRAVFHLAGREDPSKPVPIREVAEREGISPLFLEQIFNKLRRAEVIASMRGPSGGFYLDRPAEKISIKEILEAVGETWQLSECSCSRPEGCDQEEDCPTKHALQLMDRHFSAWAADYNVAAALRGEEPGAKPQSRAT